MPKKKTTKLPKSFEYLMWSYKFNLVDPEEDKDRIIINTINYGQWEHLKWVVNYFGKARLRRIIENIPVSEFRNEAGLELVRLLLNIKKMKYANRGIKIQATKNI